MGDTDTTLNNLDLFLIYEVEKKTFLYNNTLVGQQLSNSLKKAFEEISAVLYSMYGIVRDSK